MMRYATVNTATQPKVESKISWVLARPITSRIFSSMGKAKARWSTAITRGRKNTSRIWLWMLCLTSLWLMPTFCMMLNRRASS